MAVPANPLEIPLRDLLQRINFLFAFLSNCDVSLRGFRALLEDAEKKRAERGIPLRGGWSLVIGDIADLPTEDNEIRWMSQFPSGKTALEGAEYYAFVESMTHMQAGHVVAQAYEAHETYLYDLIGACVAAHPADAEEAKLGRAITKSGKHRPASPPEWRELLKEAYKGSNNKRALAYLRRLGPAIAQYETRNWRQLNLPEWYRVVSAVRHALVHQQQRIRPHQLAHLSGEEKQLLKRRFSGRMAQDGYLLAINVDEAKGALRTFGEYAHIMFRGLSESHGYARHIAETARKAGPRP